MSRISSYHGGARRTHWPHRAGAAAATPACPPTVAAERLEGRLLLATFTVTTTTADAGPGSLRQAILDANSNPGHDTIGFAIPGVAGTVHTIRPLSSLPPISDPATIDATTQPGYVATPLIELDGSAAGPSADGLHLAARPSTVRGFAINRFGGNGIVLSAPMPSPPTPFALTVEANHIGTDLAGEVALPNGTGVAIRALSVRLGGSEPTQRNIVSGNRGPGVYVNMTGRGGPDTPWMQGNYIGTNRAGDRSVGNGAEGVLVESGPVWITANVISGNAASGVRASGRLADPRLGGNFIGTDVRGAAAVPNGLSPEATFRDGVTVTDGAFASIYNEFPTPSTRARSVISGNAGSGVSARTGATANIGGAFLGTDATGSFALGNQLDGVSATDAYVTFGGNSVISGNGRDGVRLERMFGRPDDTYIAGNYIGTNAAGTAPVPNAGNGVTLIECRDLRFQYRPSTWMPTAFPPSNFISGNAGHGVLITRDPFQTAPQRLIFHHTRIGLDRTSSAPIPNGGDGIRVEGVNGVTVADRNVIAANRGNGITIADSNGVPSTGVIVQQNTVGGYFNDQLRGTRPDLGNSGHGIAIVNSPGNRIGGTRVTDGQTLSLGNRVAFNGGSGVHISARPGLLASLASENLISRNAIHGNGGLGIDLVSAGGGEGITPNDPRDADSGPNRLQNFPMITGAVVADDAAATGDVTVRFTLHSEPNQRFVVELFASPSADPAGHGEGAIFLAAVAVTADANGDAAGGVEVQDIDLPAYLTATATNVASTSEFSPAVRVRVERPTVIARHVFYNNSAFDGDDPAANAADDNAIDATVRALRPGHPWHSPRMAATNYSRGLNGLVVDVANMFTGVTPTAADFEFRTGNDQERGEWSFAPQPSVVEIRRGAGIGESDRVTIIWANGIIRDSWLEVTVKANERTGLASDDVFYFGNLVGDTVTFGSDIVITIEDLARVRTAIGRTDVPITEPSDVNKDGAVTPRDYALVRANLGRRLVDLRPSIMSATINSPPLEPARVWDEESSGVFAR